MFHLHEYRTKATHLADLLPWAYLESPSIVRNKDGSLLATFAYRGADLDSSTREQLTANAAQINNVLKRFGGGWCLYIEAQRRAVCDYPEAQWPNEASRVVDAERRGLFTAPGQFYETHYYVTVQWMPPADSEQRLAQLLYDDLPAEAQSPQALHVRHFGEQLTRCGELLREGVEWVELLEDDALLTYLKSTVSIGQHAVSTPDIPCYLDYQLGSADFVGGVYPQLDSAYLRLLTMTGFPNQSFPGVLDALHQLPFPFRYVVRYMPLDKVDAERVLSSQRRKWWQRRRSVVQHTSQRFLQTPDTQMLDNQEAVSKAEDIEAALVMLAEDLVSFGYFTGTVVVWDADHARAQDKLQQVEHAIQSRGFSTYRETLNAVEAWLGTHPGNAYANVKQPILHSLNLAHLMPCHAVWAGPERDHHLQAPALLLAQTSGQTPFRLVTHERGVGHTIIVGPTGAGKTTLVGLMALQFLRYAGAQVFLFENKPDLTPVTRAVGGQQYTLGGSAMDLAFQPLAGIDDEAYRRWAAGWIEGVLSDQNLTITPALRQEIWRALTNLAGHPPQERTMSGLMHLFSWKELRQAIEPYTIQGAYGQCLDASADTLDVGQWSYFQTERLFSLPAVVAPTLSYLFYRLWDTFTGVPTFLCLDEAWRYLGHALFRTQIEEWLRMLRTRNVSVVFSTQSLAELYESPIATILLESCPVRIFLPNDRALEEESAKWYEKAGLNDRQVQLVAQAVPRRDYYYMSREGKRLFRLMLGPQTLEILTGKKTTEKV